MKPCKFRDLVKKLKAHDKRFTIYAPPGGGSHYEIYHPDIGGKAASFPVPYHGANRDVKVGYLNRIVDRFQLPKKFFD